MISRARIFSTTDVSMAVIVALFVQVFFAIMLSRGTPPDVRADVSDDKTRPMAVAITPVLDDLPHLKLGSKPQPGKLPDMWLKPKAVPRKTEGAAPSPLAGLSPSAIPSSKLSNDAGPESDAEVVKAAEAITVGDAGPAPVSTTPGSADGTKDGTETDPLKAQAIDLYRAELDQWFSARFDIRGKVPFDTLKTLRATVIIDVTPDRKVGGYDVIKGSLNDAFDDALYRSLAKVQVSGAVLPPPPPTYPDILGKKLRLTFRCTVKAACE